MKEKVKHSGVAEEFGDRFIIVPALTTGQMEKLAETLVKHDAVDVNKGFGEIVERIKLRRVVILEAIRRNYPDFTEDEAAEFVTAGNSDRLLGIVIGMDRTSPKVREVGED